MNTLSISEVRNSSDLPFYCRPLSLFVAVWALMLGAFEFHISYTTYPDVSVALVLFTVSFVSLLAGYATVWTGLQAIGFQPRGAAHYRIDLARLRRFYLAAVVVSLAIMLMNLKLFGLPPIFGLLGADTLDYQEYGSLRQVLFTAVLTLFVSAPLETSAWRRWSLYLFAPMCLLIYGSRGYLLIMLFQALVVFSLRTSLSKTKIYLVALSTLVLAVFASNLIGNNRSSLGADAMLGALQIKHAYYDWPAAYLWVISYVSTPISNMCWIVRVYHYHGPSWSFLSSALPGFWSSKPLEWGDLGSDMIIDGVHTYLAKYYLDFWGFGIAGVNYMWGLISAFISAGDRLTRNYLISAVLLGCIGFMFFADFLSILIILMELGAAVWIQRYVTVPLPDAAIS